MSEVFQNIVEGPYWGTIERFRFILSPTDTPDRIAIPFPPKAGKPKQKPSGLLLALIARKD